MIDERLEELASLYALDLLEGLEKQGFETAMAREPELQKLVSELREAAAPMAHLIPPVAPPPELKARLLAEIGASQPAPTPVPTWHTSTPPPTATPRREAKVIAFPTWIPWAIAAGFAVGFAWTGKLYFESRAESVSANERLAVETLSLKNAQQQLEAERIIGKQQISQLAQLTQQVADTTKLLASARQDNGNNEQTLSTAQQELAETTRKLAAATQQIAQLNQQVEANSRLAGNAMRRQSELEQLLVNAGDQVGALQERLKAESDLANLQIAKLTSKNSPQALAFTVWNQAKGEGVFTVEKLPTPKGDQDYELWVIDPQKPTPVSAGVLQVGPDGTTRVQFKTEDPVSAVAKFAVSREKKGGAPKHGGPKGDVILIGP